MHTDQEILSFDNVPTEIAAKYLKSSRLGIHYALQQGVAPYGYAVKNPGGKHSYHISPGLLVAYKRGTLNVKFEQAAE